MPYFGQICTSELESLQTCFSGVASPSPPAPNIPIVTDQQQGESSITQLLSTFTFLNSTLECLEGIQPFLCLHTFRLCDDSGGLHIALRGECLRLRESVCSDVWARVELLLPQGSLPVCEDLPATTDDCVESMLTCKPHNLPIFTHRTVEPIKCRHQLKSGTSCLIRTLGHLVLS